MNTAPQGRFSTARLHPSVRRPMCLGAAACVSVALALSACTASVDPTAVTDPFASSQSVGSADGASPSSMSGAAGDTSQSADSLRQSWPEGAPGPDEGPAVTRGSGTVRIGVVADNKASLSPRLLEEFTERSGFKAEILPISRSGEAGSLLSAIDEGTPDVLMGLDPADLADLGLKDATVYGRDDVCAAVDRLFIEANRGKAAASFDELIDDAHAALFTVPDPVTSAAGRAFMLATASVKGDEAPTWWKDAAKRGVRIDKGSGATASWSALDHGAPVSADTQGASGQRATGDSATGDSAAEDSSAGTQSARGQAAGSQGEQPGASRSNPAASSRSNQAASSTAAPSYYSVVAASDLAHAPLLLNTGVESYGALIGGTCVKRSVFVAPWPGDEATTGAQATAGTVPTASSLPSAGAQAWIDFVQGAMAQRIMALDAVAWPAAWPGDQAAALASDSVLSWVAAPVDSALELSEEQWSASSILQPKWAGAFDS
ncbi:MAG: hypothetical protein KIC38_00460 [Actinomycetaceae bacterium]|nr:hypothetical protein [Actinomycetaceae bacterium]